MDAQGDTHGGKLKPEPKLLPDPRSCPLFLVFNPASGAEDAESIRARIETILGDAGREFQIASVDDAGQLAARARDSVAAAVAARGAVVAVGGDGTLNAVAQAVLGQPCAFGVIPQGTFNYFSRTHGLPLDVEDATRALLDPRIEPAQVGLVNDRIFLVNASLGLYPQLLEDREAWKAQFGRYRLVALWSGLLTLLREHRQLRLRLEDGRRQSEVLTPTLFVGNNALQLERIGIPEAEGLKAGHLAAITLRPISHAGMVWLLLRGALGQLGDAKNVSSFNVRYLAVKPARSHGKRQAKVAIDGEVLMMDTPLLFRVSPQPLYLLKPSTDAYADATQ